jgi:peptidoglycan DL-endopeptidase CwlO
MPSQVEPGSLPDLELRAARARRQAGARHARVARRLRARRQACRVLVSLGVVATAALVAVGGPQGASTITIPRAAAREATRCPVPQSLRPVFAQASQETGLPLSLLAAVAHVESRFDPQALSHAGAIGLLQLMPQTAAALHYDATETAANVMAGALYLSRLRVHYRSTQLALAAYNAGPTAVDRVGGAPSQETAAYVANVQKTWRAYGNCA